MRISLKKSWLPLTPVPEVWDASGCFETCRVKGGKVLFWKEHLQRLDSSLKTLGMDPVPQGLIHEIRRLARGMRDGFVRVAIHRSGSEPWVLHSHPGIPYSRSMFTRGISVRTVPTLASPPEAVPAQVKHSERIASILSRLEGGDSMEVLRFGIHGYLTEGTVSNLFLIKKGTLITPPAWLGILEGVTRAHVFKAASRLKIPVSQAPLTRHDLFNAEEAFLTNVLMGIMPIRRVDGRFIGTQVPGPITRRLLPEVALHLRNGGNGKFTRKPGGIPRLTPKPRGQSHGGPG